MIYAFLTNFGSKSPVGITTGKETCRIYKYNQQNWPYSSPNTTFIIPPCFDTYIQTQRNSASYASVGLNDVSSSGLDQCTNHRGNKYGKDNDDSQSYETPRGKDSVFPLLVIQSPPQPNHNHPHCLYPEKNIYVFKLKGKVTIQNNVLNQDH